MENGDKKKTIFVRNLPKWTSKEQLEDVFSEIGPLRHCIVVTNKGEKECKGFGFVTYSFEEDAKNAIKKLQGKSFPNSKNLMLLDWANRRQREGKQTEKVNKEDENTKNEESSPKPVQPTKQTKPAIPSKPQNKPNDPTLKWDKSRVITLSIPEGELTEHKLRAELKKEKGPHNYVSKFASQSPTTLKVLFGTKEAAEAASKYLNNRMIDGDKPLTISHGLSALFKIPRLILRNLATVCTEEKIRTFFKNYGEIQSITKPTEDGKKRFGFITFQKFEDAEKAMTELNTKLLCGRPVAIDWALPKDKYMKHIAITSISSSHTSNENVNDDKVENDGNDDDDGDDKSDDEGDDDEEGNSDSSMDSEGEEAKAEDDDDDDDFGLNDDDEDEGEVDSSIMDEEKGDDDDDDEDEDDDEEDDDEDESEEEEEEEKETPRVSEADQTTVFVRNLSFDTNETALRERFSEFGKIRYALIVRDHETGLSKGSAFVRFSSLESLKSCLSAAYPKIDPELLIQTSKPLDLVESGISLDGRSLILSIAVDRSKAGLFSTLNKEKPKKNVDKRNLYLAYEGVITAQDEAAKDMSKTDLNKRHKAMIEKKAKLQNPNYFVSKTRLSIRNLPRTVDENQLKELASKFVFSNEKPTRRVAKQVKIVRDKERLDETGKGRSKGYGFIEFYEHDDAMKVLREMNNNPSLYGASSRPIVEFALENVQALQKLQRSMEISKARLNKNEDSDQRGDHRNRQPGGKKNMNDKNNNQKNKNNKNNNNKNKNSNNNNNNNKNNNTANNNNANKGNNNDSIKKNKNKSKKKDTTREIEGNSNSNNNSTNKNKENKKQFFAKKLKDKSRNNNNTNNNNNNNNNNSNKSPKKNAPKRKRADSNSNKPRKNLKLQ